MEFACFAPVNLFYVSLILRLSWRPEEGRGELFPSLEGTCLEKQKCYKTKLSSEVELHGIATFTYDIGQIEAIL